MKKLQDSELISGESELIEVLEELSAVSWRMAARMKWAKSISEAEAKRKQRQETARLNGITNY